MAKERAQLGFKNRMRLAHFIEQEYAKSGMGDADFASFAGEKLSLALSPAHVSGLRVQLEIPANFPAGTNPAKQRTIALEARVKILEEQMETLLRERLAHARGPK